MLAFATVASMLYASKGLPAASNLNIMYINLDSRTDRKKKTESMLDLWGYPYKRVAGIKKEGGISLYDKKRKGSLGCALSHLKALCQFDTDVLVLEDDAQFRTTPPLEELSTIEGWDVVCFAHNMAIVNNSDCFVAGVHRFCRAHNIQTMSAYMVRKQHLQTLRQKARESAKGLEKGGQIRVFAIDMVWKQVQQSLRFYVAHPRLAKQRQSWSDIQKKKVDYGV